MKKNSKKFYNFKKRKKKKLYIKLYLNKNVKKI